MILTDSHCHIDGEQFDADREQIIENARRAGVCAMLNIGTGSPKSDSFEKTDLLTKDYDFIYGSARKRGKYRGTSYHCGSTRSGRLGLKIYRSRA